MFSRQDKMVAHVKKFHSEATKRKAEESAELTRMELLHANKVPRLSVEHQSGGAVTTRGMKRVSEETNPDVKVAKKDQEIEAEKYAEKYVKKFHSEAAKRKEGESAELTRMELLHANKVPRLSVEHQSGGAVTTRGMKRVSEETNPDVKVAKKDQEIEAEKYDTTDDSTDRCFKPTSQKWEHLKNGKKEKSLIRSLLLHWITYVTQNPRKI